MKTSTCIFFLTLLLFLGCSGTDYNCKSDKPKILIGDLIGDSTFFDMAATGWIEGDKWVQQNQATVWIIHDISNTPQPHIHVTPKEIIMHSHGHNVLDKPKKLRRFAVRCVSDIN